MVKLANTVGSIFFEHLPYIGAIQSRFSSMYVLRWMEYHWYIAIPINILYLILVFGGRSIMDKRKKYDLRKALMCWNLGLAIFSLMGFLNLAPNLIASLYHNGMQHTVCHSTSVLDPHQSLWAFLFSFSKIFELGDTAFIVLRKVPLSFLHWYHHATVLFYAWYALGNSSISTFALGQWFSTLNYGVHSVMYSYYALRAAGFKVPSHVAQLITVSQISQMFVGVYINVVAYRAHINGWDCDVNMNAFYMGVVIYGSYLALFINFFVRRYIL